MGYCGQISALPLAALALSSEGGESFYLSSLTFLLHKMRAFVEACMSEGNGLGFSVCFDLFFSL